MSNPQGKGVYKIFQTNNFPIFVETLVNICFSDKNEIFYATLIGEQFKIYKIDNIDLITDGT